MISAAKAHPPVELQPMETPNHYHVVIQRFQFVPAKLQLNIGDTVTWENKDFVAHNVMPLNSRTSITPDLKTGEQYTYTVTEGFLYQCNLHPSMRGEISILNGRKD
ncbi:MAG: plastocyanin/azurin family copper-binding protein [bacterium]